jgi:hypothetical protein
MVPPTIETSKHNWFSKTQDAFKISIIDKQIGLLIKQVYVRIYKMVCSFYHDDTLVSQPQAEASLRAP